MAFKCPRHMRQAQRRWTAVPQSEAQSQGGSPPKIGANLVDGDGLGPAARHDLLAARHARPRPRRAAAARKSGVQLATAPGA